MTSKISLEINFEGREFYLTPISLEINFEEYLKRADKEGFDASSIIMLDKVTGRAIPCQFSPSDDEKIRGTISWIHPSYAHKEVEIIVEKNKRRIFSSRYR